jgi:hypothetical protein
MKEGGHATPSKLGAIVNPNIRGVPFGRRSPLKRGPFSTPKHRHPYVVRISTTNADATAICSSVYRFRFMTLIPSSGVQNARKSCPPTGPVLGFRTTSSIRFHRPLAVQRRYCRCTEFQLPSSSGRSRRGAPVRAIQRMASGVRRWSRGGRPRKTAVSMTNGAKNAHSSSLKRPRTKVTSTAEISFESCYPASRESPSDALSTRPRRVRSHWKPTASVARPHRRGIESVSDPEIRSTRPWPTAPAPRRRSAGRVAAAGSGRAACCRRTRCGTAHGGAAAARPRR